VREFFNYVAATFLSSEHQHKRNWPGFLCESVSPAGLLLSCARPGGTRGRAVAVEADDERAAKEIQRVLATLWKELDEAAVRRLFAPGAEASLWGQVANGVLIQLMRPNARSFSRILRSLGIPHDRDGFYDLSEYRVARILYRQFDSTKIWSARCVVCTTCRRTRSTCCNCTTSCSEQPAHPARIPAPALRQVATSSAGVRQQGMCKKRRRFRSQFIPFRKRRPSAVITVEMAPQRIVAMTLADELAGRSTPTRHNARLVDAALQCRAMAR